ncbi:competence protein ComK [Aquisalibacillus elongatus]|uniref:Competence protein ComK n=1 Tax=Aquisalibacillus elongatus TaxID=485577 RepID=A0A3N5B443_9BACI|nr:competence protein ComK [Aquisalibacillus elongatus]RPF52047.1 competence protein ComK [Aquisalibacillus elongatus]
MKFNDTPTVTGKTLAILPYEMSDENIGSHVLEKGREYHTHLNPRQLMDQACKEYGSDLRGRINGTQHIAGVNRKAPIAIDTHSKVFYLPTSSPKSNECVWICYNHVLFIEKVKQKLTRVHFNSGESILINISYSSLNNQLQKTAQYRNLLEKRVSRLQKEIELDLLELQP